MVLLLPLWKPQPWGSLAHCVVPEKIHTHPAGGHQKFIYLFIFILFILLRLGVTYIKNIEDNTKPGRDTTTVRTNYSVRSKV